MEIIPNKIEVWHGGKWAQVERSKDRDGFQNDRLFFFKNSLVRSDLESYHDGNPSYSWRPLEPEYLGDYENNGHVWSFFLLHDDRDEFAISEWRDNYAKVSGKKSHCQIGKWKKPSFFGYSSLGILVSKQALDSMLPYMNYVGKKLDGLLEEIRINEVRRRSFHQRS